MSFHGRPPMVWLKGRIFNLSREIAAASVPAPATYSVRNTNQKTWQWFATTPRKA